MTKDPSALVDRPRAVRDGEALDVEALARYLDGRLAGLEPGAELDLEQFPGGHSNLTYLLTTRSGDRQWVLRRPPFGVKIATAHDMGREHRLLSGLTEAGFAQVPRPSLLCEDEAVIGAPFYVMQRVCGVILRGARVPEGLGLDDPARMRALCEAAVDNLAALHAVDVEAAGLSEMGHPEGYVARQIEGWTGRYHGARTDEIPQIEEVAAWLAANMPPERGAALIHNDYKYDNLVLDPAEPSRILAVLDWEMATVGDPLMDLGTSLGYWIDPGDPPEHRQLPFGPTAAPGNLDRRRVVERYAAASGRDVGEDGALFYYVYGLFKIAVIAQQIYKRFKDGFSNDPRFAMMIFGVRILGATAARALERGRIHDLG